MISCDTNILFHACDAASSSHERARKFLHTHQSNQRFVLCEQVLMELHGLLRNPAVCKNPLSAADAVAVIQAFRSNPAWRIVDAVQDGRMMEQVWERAAKPDCAYRRIVDLRLAATLLAHRVQEFATCNMKDFQEAGFVKVWNPLMEPAP